MAHGVQLSVARCLAIADLAVQPQDRRAVPNLVVVKEASPASRSTPPASSWAELHRIEIDAARAAGIPVEPSEARARWRSDIAAVTAAFDISAALRERWTAQRPPARCVLFLVSSEDRDRRGHGR